MLSNSVIKLLNDQMNLEFYSSNLYLQMSAWCEQQGFEGAAKFLSEHAAEEMQHMRKLFTYLNETGALTSYNGMWLNNMKKKNYSVEFWIN